MLIISATNKSNETLTITQNSKYSLISVSGITPPTANINTSELATKDGSIFNSSKVKNRNIVLTIVFNEDPETARLELYRYFRVKQYIKLNISTTNRTVYTEGYVESMQIDVNEQRQRAQISIICPEPYFKSVTPTEITFTSNPQTISNGSDEDVGFIATFTASGAVTNVSLKNNTTGAEFGLTYNLQSGDKLVIDTRTGEKGVTLTRGAVVTNLINYITASSDWVTLLVGNNAIQYGANSGVANLTLKVTLQPIYEGV